MSLWGYNSHPLTFMGGFVLAQGFTPVFMRDASLRPVRGNRQAAQKGSEQSPQVRGSHPLACQEPGTEPAGVTSLPPPVRADFLALGALGAVSFPPVFHIQPISGS